MICAFLCVTGLTLPPVDAAHHFFQSSQCHRPYTTAGDAFFFSCMSLALSWRRGLNSPLRGNEQAYALLLSSSSILSSYPLLLSSPPILSCYPLLLPSPSILSFCPLSFCPLPFDPLPCYPMLHPYILFTPISGGGKYCQRGLGGQWVLIRRMERGERAGRGGKDGLDICQS